MVPKLFPWCYRARLGWTGSFCHLRICVFVFRTSSYEASEGEAFNILICKRKKKRQCWPPLLRRLDSKKNWANILDRKLLPSLQTFVRIPELFRFTIQNTKTMLHRQQGNNFFPFALRVCEDLTRVLLIFSHLLPILWLLEQDL